MVYCLLLLFIVQTSICLLFTALRTSWLPHPGATWEASRRRLWPTDAARSRHGSGGVWCPKGWTNQRLLYHRSGRNGWKMVKSSGKKNPAQLWKHRLGLHFLKFVSKKAGSSPRNCNMTASGGSGGVWHAGRRQLHVLCIWIWWFPTRNGHWIRCFGSGWSDVCDFFSACIC